MVSSRRRWMAVFLTVLLVFSGCGSPENDTKKEPAAQTREVSSAFRGIGGSGLSADELKECGAVSYDGPVEFHDPVTEEMLRNMTGKPEGEVLRSDLQKIHAIYWRNDRYWSDLQILDDAVPWEPGKGYWQQCGQPETLEDFALCDNLQWLSLGRLEVPSLEPLASLTQLEWIEFEGAAVTAERLEELALLEEVKAFRMGNGEVTEVAGFTDGSFLLPMADRLVYLDINGGIEWNPEVLAQMTKLEVLVLANAGDLAFLTELTELKELSLYACTARDWGPLGTLQQLEYLSILGNENTPASVTLDDLRPLSGLAYLGLSMAGLEKEHTREEIIDALPGLTGLYIM